MKIRMLKTIPVAPNGIQSELWKKETVHEATEKLGNMLIDAKFAVKAGITAKPEEKKEEKPKVKPPGQDSKRKK